ncbi:MAG: hypothetical protein ACREV6_25525 [Clostridium sp.]|uniref:hypothetical protein n=1 Tax=Clostridium sp. TaxID=1506 RepID=UPI003D6D01B5
MKKKLLSLTLSALMLCSGGVIASAKTIETNHANTTIQSATHTHRWVKVGYSIDDNGNTVVVFQCKICDEIKMSLK